MHGMRTLALAAALISASCSTNTDLTNRPLFDNGVNVFEAQVVDGLTGAIVDGASVSIQIGRHVLEARNDAGFFTVYGIPHGTFRARALAPGYNAFNALKAFTMSSPSASLTQGDPLVYYFNNIVMYPEGTVPQGIVVAVFDGTNGAPVAGATVVASLQSVGAPVPVASVLAPNVGLLPTTLTATTAGDGKATLDATGLIMGGSYEIDVFGALDAAGVYLVPASNQTVTVGVDVQQVPVFLSRPLLFPVALKANNEDNLLHTTLEVTFPYGVDVCSMAMQHGWTNSTIPMDTNGNGVFAQPAPMNPVSLTLKTNDTVLALGHAANPITDDPGDDLRVTFTGVTVRPKGASMSSCTSLSSVRLRNTSGGATIDTEIRVRDVP